MNCRRTNVGFVSKNTLQCTRCRKSLQTPVSLRNHAVEVHATNTSNFPCKTCRIAGFATLRALIKHKQRCWGEHWEDRWNSEHKKISNNNVNSNEIFSRLRNRSSLSPLPSTEHDRKMSDLPILASDSLKPPRERLTRNSQRLSDLIETEVSQSRRRRTSNSSSGKRSEILLPPIARNDGHESSMSIEFCNRDCEQTDDIKALESKSEIEDLDKAPASITGDGCNSSGAMLAGANRVCVLDWDSFIALPTKKQRNPSVVSQHLSASGDKLALNVDDALVTNEFRAIDEMLANQTPVKNETAENIELTKFEPKLLNSFAVSSKKRGLASVNVSPDRIINTGQRKRLKMACTPDHCDSPNENKSPSSDSDTCHRLSSVESGKQQSTGSASSLLDRLHSRRPEVPSNSRPLLKRWRRRLRSQSDDESMAHNGLNTDRIDRWTTVSFPISQKSVGENSDSSPLDSDTVSLISPVKKASAVFLPSEKFTESPVTIGLATGSGHFVNENTNDVKCSTSASELALDVGPSVGDTIILNSKSAEHTPTLASVVTSSPVQVEENESSSLLSASSSSMEDRIEEARRVSLRSSSSCSMFAHLRPGPLSSLTVKPPRDTTPLHSKPSGDKSDSSGLETPAKPTSKPTESSDAHVPQFCLSSCSSPSSNQALLETKPAKPKLFSPLPPPQSRATIKKLRAKCGDKSSLNECRHRRSSPALKSSARVAAKAKLKTKPTLITWRCPGCPLSSMTFKSAKELLSHLPMCHKPTHHRASGNGGSVGGGSVGQSRALWPKPLSLPGTGFGCSVCGFLLASESRLDKHRKELHEKRKESI